MSTHLLPAPPLQPASVTECCGLALAEVLGPDATFTFEREHADCPALDTAVSQAVALGRAIVAHRRAHHVGGTGLADINQLDRDARRLIERLWAEEGDREQATKTEPPEHYRQMLTVDLAEQECACPGCERAVGPHGYGRGNEVYCTAVCAEHHGDTTQAQFDHRHHERATEPAEPSEYQLHPGSPSTFTRRSAKLAQETEMLHGRARSATGVSAGSPGLNARHFTRVAETMAKTLAPYLAFPCAHHAWENLSGAQQDDCRDVAVRILEALDATTTAGAGITHQPSPSFAVRGNTPDQPESTGVPLQEPPEGPQEPSGG